MPNIKFSHHYPKLHSQTFARLKEAIIIERKHISKKLIEYDTMTSEGEYYKLPYGKLIYLLFIGNDMIPFCTIRRYTPEKYDYYKKNENELFIILITD